MADSLILSNALEELKKEIQMPRGRLAALYQEREELLLYIPRKKNEVLFHLMDAGKNLYGVIEGIGESDRNWIEIWIDVFMED